MPSLSEIIFSDICLTHLFPNFLKIIKISIFQAGNPEAPPQKKINKVAVTPTYIRLLADSYSLWLNSNGDVPIPSACDNCRHLV